MSTSFQRPAMLEHPSRTGGLLLVLITLASPAAQAQSMEGERLFRQRCATCHSIEEAGRGSGPSLAGVFGREAGSLEGARYSPAMQEAGLTWDEETLEQFLGNPRDTVPGTTMAVRISDPAQRAAIISFLQNAGNGG